LVMQQNPNYISYDTASMTSISCQKKFQNSMNRG
jgi:hypothetical protein